MALTPLPTIIATGVASPNAQGQLITSTDIPRASANPISRPAISHAATVIAAIMSTTGTNTPETLSATFAIGALVAEASVTVFIISAKVVSPPTRVALHFTKPNLLIVAADTLSPTALSTGILSPVRADSSTEV